MPKYSVKVIERMERTVEVEAESVEEALEFAADAASEQEGRLEYHSDAPRSDWSVFNYDTQSYEQ